MQHSHHAPPCPRCGTPVYRSHTCRVSGLTTRPGRPVVEGVPKPADFDAQVERARRQARVEALAFELDVDEHVASARLRLADAAWSEDVGL